MALVVPGGGVVQEAGIRFLIFGALLVLWSMGGLPPLGGNKSSVSGYPVSVTSLFLVLQGVSINESE